MKTKLLLPILILFFACSAIAIENSIIPTIEHFEILENLPRSKYAKGQLREIQESLACKENKIRLMTYNILSHDHDEHRPFIHQWEQRLPRLIALIEDAQPDIINMQEVYPKQLEDLIPLLEKTYCVYSGIPDDDQETNVIFYRKDRFQTLSRRGFHMRGEAGSLTMVKLKDLNTNATFAVFNTHLAYSKIDKREQEVLFITQLLQPLAQKMPVIFTGDLNTFSHRLDLTKLPFYDGDYIHKLLTQASLRNAKESSLLGHLGPISTFTNSGENPEPFKGVGTPGIFLDHVYVSPQITVLIHAVQPATVDGQFPSDHMPIVVDFVP